MVKIVNKTEFRYAPVCLNCKNQPLVDTGETFESGIMQKYRCPVCGQNYTIRKGYRISERTKLEDMKSKDGETT